MSRKKKHTEHVNHERWLVSYADFMTLLFALFVVLFASGQADKKKQQKFASAFQQAFSQMALFEPHAKQPPLNDSSGADPSAQPKPVEMPVATQPSTTGSGVAQTLHTNAADALALMQRAQIVRNVQGAMARQLAQGLPAAAQVTLRQTREGTVISLREGGFFASGSATLQASSVSTLLAIAAELPPSTVCVEGHTDDRPIHSAQFASNWELSSARASTIARFLLEHSSVMPADLSVAGYAEFHPAATNDTPEGRATNRRVDIVLLGPPLAAEAGASQPDPVRADVTTAELRAHPHAGG